MVVYTCDRCKKIFRQKCKYDRHLQRKIPCKINENIDNGEVENDSYCEVCDKLLSRTDVLKNHEKTCQTHKLLKEKFTIEKKCAKTKNGDINQATGNKNQVMGNKNQVIDNKNQVIRNKNQVIRNKNVIINKKYHVILPFGNEEIDELTPEEKIEIFKSEEYPIIKIILMTNLNHLKPKYHNVGYKNMNLGWGWICDGKSWKKKDVHGMMNNLICSKIRDLLKIYNEIKEYLSEDQRKTIQTKLNDIEKIAEPRSEHDFRNKKKLIANLKHMFTDNNYLIKEAMKGSGKPIIEYGNEKTRELDLKDGYTMERMIKEMNQKSESARKIFTNKEIAKDLLEELNNINDDEYQLIEKRIDQTNDMDTLNIIIRSLNGAMYSPDEFNSEILENKIKNEKKINDMIFE
jgi:hypothetical protein